MRTRLGQYQIEGQLGRGGMGVVYHGVHEHLGRQVAVKALAPELTQQPEFKERFFAEAKTQARLQHPNIVGVYDLLEDGGEFFIVMEYVQGQGLDELLRQDAGRGMELSQAIAIFSQVLTGLDYAHSEGVIHRDIKPSNVLVTASGKVKLTDFGIALLMGDKRLTASRSLIGTPAYMSPEQILRPREVDHRTDLYSAAILLYEMLAGRPPFEGESEYGIIKQQVEAAPPDLSRLRPALPAALVGVVGKALAKNPDERFASGAIFLSALNHAVPHMARTVTPAHGLAGGLPRPPAPQAGATVTEAPAPTPGLPGAAPAPPRPKPPGGGSASPFESRALWILVAGALVALALGVVGVMVLYRHFAGNAGPQTQVAETQTSETQASKTQGAENRLTPPPPQAANQVPPAAREMDPISIPAEASRTIEDPAGSSSPPGQLEAPLDRPRTPPPAASKAPPPRDVPPKTSAPPRETRTQAAPPVVPPRDEPSRPEVSADDEEAEADEPEPREPATTPSPARRGDDFDQMQRLLEGIERLQDELTDAYDDEDLAPALNDPMEKFEESASDTLRTFKRAIGGGRFSGMRSRAATEAAQKQWMSKIKDLIRQGHAIDSLMRSAGPGPKTLASWQKVKRLLTQLEAIT